MLTAIDDIRSEMDSLYEGFMCGLCDGKNHKFIIPGVKGNKGSITVNSEWC